MLLMAVTLQEDLGMHYNRERISEAGDVEPNDVFFADSRDVFIHGLIADDRRMGTCSSMPVLYVAVGRRLGYPLKLVPTRNHLFVRWEDSRKRFNVDATGRGMNLYDDNYYRQWPMPVSPEQEEKFGYLKSMTATDEMTAFLSLRGHCLFAMGKVKEGLEAHEMALRLSPDSRLQRLITAKAREEVQQQGQPVAYLPPELLDPFWPRRRPAPAQALNLPGIAPAIPSDPNPFNAVKNR
jgi:regulator of sirC expression with transglutaminase-like and TPR domain